MAKIGETQRGGSACAGKGRREQPACREGRKGKTGIAARGSRLRQGLRPARGAKDVKEKLELPEERGAVTKGQGTVRSAGKVNRGAGGAKRETGEQ